MTASKQLLVKQRHLQDDPQTGLFFFFLMLCMIS